MRVSGAIVVGLFLFVATSPVRAGDVIWGGGTGDWSASANWIHEGETELSASTVFGRRNGLEVGTGELGTDVFIFGGDVTYDPATYGDFRYRATSSNQAGTLNLLAGTVFSMSTNDGTEDGYWTQYDGKELNINDSVFSRGANHSNGSTGGALIFGSWRSYQDQAINVNISGGGLLENDGQIWFGTPGDNAPGLDVIFSLNNGHLDLTGGNAFTLDNDGELLITADMAFVYGYNGGTGAPKEETYAINFIGPGSITVDQGGIIIAHEVGVGSYAAGSTTRRTYQDLWNAGILQANGQSGLTGANFATYFTTSGTSGQENYRLVSRQVGADFNGDGNYDVIDLNELMEAIADNGNTAVYDLNQDLRLDLGDRDAWLADAGGRNLGAGLHYLLGDANLSGFVDAVDLDVIQLNAFTDTTSWNAGNFDAAGGVDGTDFNIWNQNKFRSAFDAAAVPEPASVTGLTLVAFALAARRIRARR